MNRVQASIWWFLLLSPLISHSQTKQVSFKNDLTWNQILAKAKDEHKYIFMDCVASWCGPCKMMDRDVYNNDSVADLVNSKFISVKVQFDSTKTDDADIRQWYVDAKNINDSYKISSFPTFLFASPDGVVEHRDVGFKTPAEFVEVLNSALDTTKQYYRLVKRFETYHDLDSAKTMDLIAKASLIGDTAIVEKLANSYIDHLEQNKLYSKDAGLLIANFTHKSSERGFNVLRFHSDQLNKFNSDFSPQYAKLLVEQIIYAEQIKPFLQARDGMPDWSKINKNISPFDSLGKATLSLFLPSIIFKSEILPQLKVNPDWTRVLALIRRNIPIRALN